MESISEGSLLWAPGPHVLEQANLTHYMRWLNDHRGLTFDRYAALWQWSVDELEAFWDSLWEYFDLQVERGDGPALAGRVMPGADWFPGAKVNWAENLFHRMKVDGPALLYKGEQGPLREVTRAELWEQTAALANALAEMGVRSGDRVVAYLPNIPEAVVGVLAAASLGAIWSSCPPEFGSRSVLDRFTQIEPKVLIACSGYDYGGKTFDRREILVELQANLPTLEHTILLPHAGTAAELPERTILWSSVMQGHAGSHLTFERLPFDAPLWILYSSGTTGLPKPIVHGQGGVLLEHVKAVTFHNDLNPDDRFFWYSSTGWMMWNYVLGSLLSGCTAILYNGSPAFPDMNALWQLAADTGMTYFGTSAAFISACIKAEIQPNQGMDLSQIRAVGSTGSPLTVSGFEWIYNNVNAHLALESLSGGTDLCTAFVGGARTLPIYAGEIQGASLGAKVLAYNDAAEAVLDEVGELVIAEPMPSMPVYFWNDPDHTRYLASYFDMFPGIWRHGDWIKFNDRGGCIIYGRSDSTINRQGVRMGTSEIYQVVESFDEVQDSLIIDLEMLGRESFMPLFLVMRPGATLDDALRSRINARLRTEISPRHIPNKILEINEVPYTLSGKKMEVPIRRILLGQDPDKAANLGAMRNPGSMQFFMDYARALAG